MRHVHLTTVALIMAVIARGEDATEEPPRPTALALAERLFPRARLEAEKKETVVGPSAREMEQRKRYGKVAVNDTSAPRVRFQDRTSKGGGMSTRPGFTDDLSIALPTGMKPEDVARLILQGLASHDRPEVIAQRLVARGMAANDVSLAADRTMGGLARAETGNPSNEPDQKKDPIAHASYRLCLADPDLVRAIRTRPPETGQLARSNAASWQLRALEGATEVERLLRAGDVNALTREVALQPGAPADAALALLEWIARHVRLDEGSWVAADLAAPSETARLGHGRSGDLALLAVGLLRAAGYAADLALSTSEDPALEPAKPSAVLGRAVVRLRGPPSIWLDPASGLPPGQVGDDVQERLALVLVEPAEALSRLPRASMLDNVIERSRTIELPVDGSAPVTEVVRATGTPKVAELKRLRLLTASGSAASWGHLGGIRPGGASFDVPGSIGVGGPLVYSSRQAASRWGSTIGGRGQAFIGPGEAFSRLAPFLYRPAGQPGAPLPPGPPVRVGEPRVAILRYRVTPPPGFALVRLPMRRGFALGPVRFDAAIDEEPGGAVAATYRFELGGDVARQDLEALQEALHAAMQLVVVEFAPKAGR